MKQWEHNSKGDKLRGVGDLPIQKQKKAASKQKDNLKNHWDQVETDAKAAQKGVVNEWYNFAWSLFTFLKDLEQAPHAQSYLVYLSQLIGTLVNLYKDQGDKAVTAGFEREVQEAADSTALHFYSPRSCETGHALEGHDDKEVGMRLTHINQTLRALPSNLIHEIEITKTADLSLIETSGLHSKEYIQALKNTQHEENAFEQFNDKERYPHVFMCDIPYKANTLDAIQAALGASHDAVTRTLRNQRQSNPEKLFCVVRPPSHHAHHAHPEGFCYVSTMMYAAKTLMDAGNNVLIVDFDAHHGNGTVDQLNRLLAKKDDYQHRFHFIDIFGADESYITNLPTHEQSTPHMTFYPLSKHTYTAHHVLKSLDEGIKKLSFQPDVILVSAGFDAVTADQYSGKLTSQDYSPIGARLAAACPHMISFLEGGYNLTALPQSVKHYMLGTAGPVGQPAPSHVKEGLNFIYHAVRPFAPCSNESASSPKKK